MHSNAIFASSGATTGFSLVALSEWIASPTTGAGLAFLGSVATTAFSWYLARRADAARSKIELEREAREESRRQKDLDAAAQAKRDLDAALAALKIRQLEAAWPTADAAVPATIEASPQ